MKRMHINLSVSDLERSTRFYTAFFGAEPMVSKSDYRKWMLDDPLVNFSIEPTGAAPGVAHLGMQASDDDELQTIYAGIERAEAPQFEEGETECCYAHSFKNWTSDPDGIVWEAFFTDGERRDYGTAVSEKFAEERKTASATRTCCA